MLFGPTADAHLPRVGIGGDRLVREPGFDISGQVEGFGIPRQLVLGHRLLTDRFQRLRNRRIERPHRRNQACDHLVQHLLNFAASHRLLVRQQLVEDASQRIDVGSGIQLVNLSQRLFGRHVGRRPHDLAHLSLTARTAHSGLYGPLSGCGGGRCVEGLVSRGLGLSLRSTLACRGEQSRRVCLSGLQARDSRRGMGCGIVRHIGMLGFIGNDGGHFRLSVNHESLAIRHQSAGAIG